jgi:tetratricopeptide (TPR) repeat protein
MGSGFNRPFAGSYGGGWFSGGSGGWGDWGSYPSAWGALAGAGLGYAASSLTPWAESSGYEYSNPYYDSSWSSYDSSSSSYAVAPPPTTTEATPIVVQVPAPLNYSQPIAVPTQAEVRNTDAAVVDDSMDHFSKARSYFMDGKYVEATAEAELALKVLPGDRTIHEFRALCMFARKLYKEGAAALYAVLAAGPGWDWKTMSALYPDNDTYTAQLRALEQYVKDNTKDAQGRFLLGYHYTVLEDKDSAAEQFRYASELQPKDQLSKQLADALAAKAPAESSDRD